MIENGKREARLAYAATSASLAERRLLHRPAHLRRRAADGGDRPGRDLRPGPGGDQARDLDEALGIANGTEYALTGGSSRAAREHRAVRRQFRVGNLYINRKITGALVDRQPFGGFKMSGIGTKAGGPDYCCSSWSRGRSPRTRCAGGCARGVAATGWGGDGVSDATRSTPMEDLRMQLSRTAGSAPRSMSLDQLQSLARDPGTWQFA